MGRNQSYLKLLPKTIKNPSRALKSGKKNSNNDAIKVIITKIFQIRRLQPEGAVDNIVVNNIINFFNKQLFWNIPNCFHSDITLNNDKN